MPSAETGHMSAVETWQMSAVETRQMSAAEAGQMPSVLVLIHNVEVSEISIVPISQG